MFLNENENEDALSARMATRLHWLAAVLACVLAAGLWHPNGSRAASIAVLALAAFHLYRSLPGKTLALPFLAVSVVVLALLTLVAVGLRFFPPAATV